ncbi:MAG: cytochrome c [Myxococcota bacterium]
MSRWIEGLAALLVVACTGDDPALESGDTGEEEKEVGVSIGAQVFAANCARCHGNNGEGGIGPKLAGRALIPFDVIGVVTNGQGTMPAFGNVLTIDEIDSVAFFVETL